MSKTVILVCAHKQDACLKTPPYQPVQVGRAISQTELPFAVGDDTGDNISDRNRHYCELTAHYWAWKNLHDADYIGLNHYRRYFDFEGGSACSLRTVRSEAFFSASHPSPTSTAFSAAAISSWPGRRSIPTTSTRIIASATSKATC